MNLIQLFLCQKIFFQPFKNVKHFFASWPLKSSWQRSGFGPAASLTSSGSESVLPELKSVARALSSSNLFRDSAPSEWGPRWLLTKQRFPSLVTQAPWSVPHCLWHGSHRADGTGLAVGWHLPLYQVWCLDRGS